MRKSRLENYARAAAVESSPREKTLNETKAGKTFPRGLKFAGLLPANSC